MFSDRSQLAGQNQLRMARGNIAFHRQHMERHGCKLVLGFLPLSFIVSVLTQ